MYGPSILNLCGIFRLMVNPFQKLETFLRIDQLKRTSNQLRTRAVYLIALSIIVSQIVNMAIMYNTYGGFGHLIIGYL